MSSLIFFLVLILVWQAAYWLGIDVLHIFRPYVMPSPIGVCTRFLELLQNDCCEPPCGCWELNLGPLEEQQVLLTTEPSL